MRIVGIDPGIGRIGYALLERGSDGRLAILRAETILTPAGPVAERLVRIEKELGRRLKRDRPEAAAVEKLFFAKNAKTAIAVAEARGVILLTVRRLVRSIYECAPLEVKMAVTGYGRAGKSDVRRMVGAMIPDASLPRSDDLIDAIAIAITALASQRFGSMNERLIGTA